MHAVVAGIVAAIATYLLTPVAMRVARATNFMDRPAGYKGHQRATPYLGGSAIFVGLLAGLAVGGLHHNYTVVIVAAAIVWIMGTIDDHVSLPILLRVTVEIALAIWLAASGLGWTIFHQGLADGVLTVLWMLGLMNAFNLMDNMDGAAASTAAASAIGAAGIALMSNQRAPATVCLATAGACIGFLRWNLAKPAKIFMGDGGSLPLGLIVAAMTMSTVNRDYFGPRGVVAAALVVALVIFDTTLVTISRSRAGRSVMSGGRDHTTHRLKALLGTPQRVALTLAFVQLLLCAATLGVVKAGGGWIFLAGGLCVIAGAVLLWQLETKEIFEPEQIPQVSRAVTAPTNGVEALAPPAAANGEAAARRTASAEDVLARSARSGA